MTVICNYSDSELNVKRVSMGKDVETMRFEIL